MSQVSSADHIRAQTIRSTLLTHVRDFFNQRGYQEVHTPTLVPCPGNELHLRYFETRYTDFHLQKQNFFLRTSPEMHMKQLLGMGMDKIFQIAPCFRNFGEMSDWHNPEFLMLEWYNCDQSFEQMMQETHELLAFLGDAAVESKFNKKNIIEKTPQKLTVASAFKNFAGIDLIDGDVGLAKKAIENQIASVKLDDDFETAFFKILLEKIEPALRNLDYCILHDYPASQAALAKIENGTAKRFEFYLHGIEICNAFYELWNERENRQRFAEAKATRQQMGYEYQDPPEDFFRSFDRRLDNVSGNALGLERVFALLSGASSIRPFFAPTGI